MRRFPKKKTISLYFLPPEYFPLPFDDVTCSFPRPIGAPRPRPLLPCLKNGEGTQYTLKLNTKENGKNHKRGFRTHLSA